jgi:sugar phosphate isomerase/epimerase
VEPCLFSAALPGWDAAYVARTALDAGLTAVEWGIGPGQAVESPHEGAAASLGGLGVEAAGVCVQGGGASLTDPETLRPFAALAAELGAPHVRVFAPALDEREHARDRLAAAAAITKEHGATLLVETAPDTIAPSTAQARALVDGFPPHEVGVLYDPGNMVIEGHVDPRLAIAELGPYLRHVHVKNIAWRREHGRWTWRHATLDEGLLDWGAIVAVLHEASYSGRLCLDHLGGKPSLITLRRELSVLARPT